MRSLQRSGQRSGELVLDNAHRAAGAPLLEAFSDADDRLEPSAQGALDLGGNDGVGLVMVEPDVRNGPE